MVWIATPQADNGEGLSSPRNFNESLPRKSIRYYCCYLSFPLFRLDNAGLLYEFNQMSDPAPSALGRKSDVHLLWRDGVVIGETVGKNAGYFVRERFRQARGGVPVE